MKSTLAALVLFADLAHRGGAIATIDQQRMQVRIDFKSTAELSVAVRKWRPLKAGHSYRGKDISCVLDGAVMACEFAIDQSGGIHAPIKLLTDGELPFPDDIPRGTADVVPSSESATVTVKGATGTLLHFWTKDVKRKPFPCLEDRGTGGRVLATCSFRFDSAGKVFPNAD